MESGPGTGQATREDSEHSQVMPGTTLMITSFDSLHFGIHELSFPRSISISMQPRASLDL
jgi:hypothetical protein